MNNIDDSIRNCKQQLEIELQIIKYHFPDRTEYIAGLEKAIDALLDITARLRSFDLEKNLI